MQAAGEAGDLFSLLEGGAGGARAAAEALAALYAAVREPWLVRALLLYHARTGSQRALELLARAPEHHARHALDALAEQLRAGERGVRHHALGVLAPLLARRPPWHHLLLPPSPVPRELVRAARREAEPVPLLNALLALAALLPAVPVLAAQLAPELAEALTRPPTSPHLALGARALFLAAYAQAPCSLVEALRGAGVEEPAVERLTRGVRLHPALVTGSRRAEAEGARPPRAPHDLVSSCRRVPPPSPPPPPASPGPQPASASAQPPPPGSGAQAARAAGALRPGGDGWWSLGERSGAEAAPHTPLPEREREPELEPEPAVEATPENTPARLARPAFRFPGPESPAARAIGRTPPPHVAPLHDACAARLARVQAERQAQDSPVPIGGAPPSAAARPQPRQAPAAAPASDQDERDRDEDREVRELTARALSAAAWAEPCGGGGGVREESLRARAPAPPRRAPSFPAPPPCRAGSAPPQGAPHRDAASQTLDSWPEPYEFLVSDLFAALPDEHDKHKSSQSEATDRFIRGDAGEPAERLDRYLAELYAGGAPRGGGAGGGDLAEQLALAHAQLMYERWRRDLHAERNRSLLGHCRKVRALELENQALEERTRALTRERDALRIRAAAAPSVAPSASAPTAQEMALERALEAERAGRLRTEAACREAEGARMRDAAELQRTRGESFEAARHVEALARAALAAERRAEHVRRLRRELLLLGEREARLAAAVSAALHAPARPEDTGAERALRAALARAEAEAEAAGVRAETASARAHDLEAALGAREAALQELKRSTRAMQEEGGARLRALHDKYAALLRVVRAAGARELEQRARAVPDALVK